MSIYRKGITLVITAIVIVLALSLIKIRTNKYDADLKEYFRQQYGIDITTSGESYITFKPLPTLVLSNVNFEKNGEIIIQSEKLILRLSKQFKNSKSILIVGSTIHLSSLSTALQETFQIKIKKQLEESTIAQCDAVFLKSDNQSLKISAQNCADENQSGDEFDKKKINQFTFIKNDKEFELAYKSNSNTLKISATYDEGKNLSGEINGTFFKNVKSKTVHIASDFQYTNNGDFQTKNLSIKNGTGTIVSTIKIQKSDSDLVDIVTSANVIKITVMESLISYIFKAINTNLFDDKDINISFNAEKVLLNDKMQSYKLGMAFKKVGNNATLDGLLENLQDQSTIQISLKNDARIPIPHLQGDIFVKNIDLSSLKGMKSDDNSNLVNELVEIISQEYRNYKKIDANLNLCISEGQISFDDIIVTIPQESNAPANSTGNNTPTTNLAVKNGANIQDTTANIQSSPTDDTGSAAPQDGLNRLSISHSMCHYGINELRYNLDLHAQQINLDNLHYHEKFDQLIATLYAADLGRVTDHYKHIFKSNQATSRISSYYNVDVAEAIFKANKISNLKFEVTLDDQVTNVKDINVESDVIKLKGNISLSKDKKLKTHLDANIFVSKVNFENCLKTFFPQRALLEKMASPILEKHKLSRIIKSDGWNFFSLGRHSGNITITGEEILLSPENMIIGLTSSIKIVEGIGIIEELTAKYQDNAVIKINGNITLNTIAPSVQLLFVANNISNHKMSKNFDQNTFPENVFNLNGMISSTSHDIDSFIPKMNGNVTYAGRNVKIEGFTLDTVINNIDTNNLQKYKTQDMQAVILEDIATGESVFDKVSGTAMIQQGFAKIKVAQLLNNRVNGVLNMIFDLKTKSIKGNGSFAFSSRHNPSSPIHLNVSMTEKDGKPFIKFDADSIAQFIQKI